MTLVRCLSLASALLLLPVASFGQNTPAPPAQEAPVGAFLGRYLDSAQKRDLQCPIRTYRAYDVKASSEDGLLYFAIGSAFVGQNPATFADRLASEPLATGFRGEKYLAFDHWYRREQCAYDIQTSIRDFDWDDRGYKYVMYAAEGLVILDEDFQEVNLAADVMSTDHLVFRNGSSYYVLSALEHSAGPGWLHDVTDPTDVQFVRQIASTGAMAKSRDGRIALLNNDDVLRIYTTGALVSGAAPSFTFTPPGSSFLVDITTDGTRFYAAVNDAGGTTLYVFTPSGETYAESIAATDLNAWEIRYGAGYVVVLGGQGARFFEVGDDGLTQVAEDRLSWYNDEAFDRRRLDAVQPVVAGDRTVLVVAALGVGDVFELEAHDPMTVSQAFEPVSIDLGGTSQLTVTITNPRAAPVLFGLAPAYTSGLVNAAAPAPSTTCSGATIIAAADGTSFALSNATLAPNASCTVTVTLTSATPGNYINTIPAGAIDSVENTNAAEATGVLVVLAPLGPPPSLTAYATSSTTVGLIWPAVTGSPTYEIFRNDVYIGSTTSNSTLDVTAIANTSYIYKVRTAGTSGFSPADIATTVVFIDTSLTGVAVKAVHITELRTAVNALRQLAALGAATFTDNPLVAGTGIKAVHITELRSALDPARAALGQATLTYGALSTIRAADVLELRAGTQ